MRGAGAKTELVTFERESRVADGGGGAAASWATLGTAWAEVRYLRGGEAGQRGALRELSAYRFLVLSEAVAALGLTTADRLVWNGVTFQIREQPRRLPRSAETEIVAEAGVGL